MKPAVIPIAPGREMFKFRLYVTGNTENSVAAATNLTAICRTHIPDRHEIEYVDVSVYPERALTDGIFMTPALIKLAPSPTCMIVGTLSNPQPVLQVLGLGLDDPSPRNQRT